MKSAAARRPCHCGCGRTFARTRTMPLCKPAVDRVYERMATLPLLDERNAASRRSNRVWVDEKTVLALLAGDLAEAQRRVAFRAANGLYSDPDRQLVAAGV